MGNSRKGKRFPCVLVLLLTVVGVETLYEGNGLGKGTSNG